MRLNDTLEALRPRIRAVAAAHGANTIRLFGSVARGEDTPESDVDFLVTLRHGASLLDVTRLELALEELLQRRVDVVTEESLQEPIRAAALRQAVSV